MVTRSLNFEEIKDFTWKTYKMDISTKESFIKFLSNLHIKTKELAFDRYNIYIHTTDIIIAIVTNKNEVEITSFNHIYKNNSIRMRIGGKLCTWSQIQKKVKTVYFIDNLNLHESVRHLWNEKGFKFDVAWDLMEKVKQDLKNKIENELLIEC